MIGYAALQASFQKAILDGDDTVLAQILDGPSESRAAMLGVYRNAYLLRLVEALGKEHELLRLYLGDETFGEMAVAYFEAHPSRHPSIRWIARSLPSFLSETEPYSDHPALAELTALEKALNDAFDAEDGPILAAADLGGVPPEAWPDLVFVGHPSVRRLSFATNAAAIWSALREEQDPPEAEALAAPCHLLVWRHDTLPMVREMTTEEAMMWDEAANGVGFGQLCVLAATYDDPDTAAGRAAGYLGSWVEAGALSSAIVP